MPVDKSIKQPLPVHQCPLCGGANNCAPASAGTFNVECWCKEVSFSAEVLDRVPEALRNKACICQACVKGEAVSGDS